MAAGNGGQLEVSQAQFRLPEDYETELDPAVSEEDALNTKSAVYNFVFTRAEGDQTLSKEEAESFRDAREAHFKTNDTSEGSGATNGEMVGKKLANLGDEIDALCSDQFADCVSLYENPQEALRSFNMVLTNVFEWEEGGTPNITLGRIGAVLGYCYHMVKFHVHKYLDSHKLLSILGMLAVFIVKFLFKAQVYDWIKKQGGWGNLLSIGVASGWLGNVVGNKYYFLAVAAVSVGAFLYMHLKGR